MKADKYHAKERSHRGKIAFSVAQKRTYMNGEKRRTVIASVSQDDQLPLSLTEQVARYVLARKAVVATGNRGLVTGLKKEISKAVDAGFSVKDVFHILKESGRVKCSYQTFRLHVNALVGPKKNRRQAAEEPKQQDHLPPVISRPPPLPTFTWDPTPNLKDLF